MKEFCDISRCRDKLAVHEFIQDYIRERGLTDAEAVRTYWRLFDAWRVSRGCLP
jgi:hypothetical protein